MKSTFTKQSFANYFLMTIAFAFVVFSGLANPALTRITPTDTDGVLVFQANHTNSPLGNWEMVSLGHPNYFGGASNDTMFYFTGNQPSHGPADSPLAYTFIAPESGTYELTIRSSRDLKGAASDHCNDFYVRMAGDFQPGTSTFDMNVLTSNTKHYFSSVPDRTWGWTRLGERTVNGEHLKLRFRYVLKQGEVYTLTVSGRSQRAIMDYVILFNASKVTVQQAQAAKLIMETPPDGSLKIILDETRGTVTKNPDKPVYDPGEEVVLTAVPEPGFLFNSWGLDVNSTDNPLTVTMNSTMYIQANFDVAPPADGSLIIDFDDIRGTVSKNPDKIVFDPGETVVVTAEPNPGYVFSNWSGDIASDDNPLTITMDSTIYITANFGLESIPVQNKTVLFYDSFNQEPVNPIVSSGDPVVDYTVWTTVTDPELGGGTALIEEYAPGDGVIKLLARESTSQAGNRTEVSAPLSFYNALFNPILNANTDTLEWLFTAKQNRSSTGGTNGFSGTNTGMAVVLAADSAVWGSQQGSNAKGYAITYLKPNAADYCISLSRFDGGLSSHTVIAGNKSDDVFSDRRNWITVRVIYIPATNEWSLYFRDEESITQKGSISNTEGMRLIETVVDDTFTDIEMTHFGFALNTPAPGGGGANPNAFFVDDFKVSKLGGDLQLFTLTTEVVGGTGGEIIIEPDQEEHSSGSLVEIIAIPDNGYMFVGWSGDVTSTLNPFTVMMNSNKDIKANFAPEMTKFTLTITTENGTVAQSIEGTEFSENTEVILTATPDAGYEFAGWSGDATGTDNPLTITMDANKNISASFTAIAIPNYTLTITAVNGTVSLDPDLTEFEENTQVVLTATPDAGYEFAGWSGDATGTDNPLTITMDTNKNITASFTAIVLPNYTMTITAANGTVAQSIEGTEFAENTEVVLTATADAGYEFAGWSGDAAGTDNPITITMDTNKNITANFILGTSIREMEVKFSVYPNPSRGIFSIQVMQPISYKVYNLNGVLVKEGNALEAFSLDLTGFNNALYILQVATQDGVSVERIMKISE
jgi:uncharacterized repeat protein (TIGR02543 family)